MTRRLAILFVLAFPAILVAGDPKPATVVAAVGVTVRDLDRSVAFYREVLGFEKVSDVEVAGEPYERLTGVFGCRLRQVRLRLGEEHLELTEFLAPRGRPIPGESRSNDGWFQHVAIVVSDMDEAYRHLRKHKVEHASTGPQRLPDWNKAAGGIEAFYFKDPDDHVLEVIHFPPGKGDPSWQARSDRLFRGIDHTAIVVRDTDRSLKFYRDTLGLRVAGESENYGPEQERLNNVFGARLRITTLRAAKGPGVELLEYLAPRDGRPMPADTKANDLWHWQTRMETTGIEKAIRGASILNLPERKLGFGRGRLTRDPDGHAVMLVE
ncbi:MAG TPA: VOC family protein [Gemmataceae bacterium]|jgi:catechol 2,3-dioxygenase-like lactoylglutathione lyase family enzyme|nr:VOC family protein [Gemmataceae bacterium]